MSSFHFKSEFYFQKSQRKCWNPRSGTSVCSSYNMIGSICWGDTRHSERAVTTLKHVQYTRLNEGLSIGWMFVIWRDNKAQTFGTMLHAACWTICSPGPAETLNLYSVVIVVTAWLHTNRVWTTDDDTRKICSYKVWIWSLHVTGQQLLTKHEAVFLISSHRHVSHFVFGSGVTLLFLWVCIIYDAAGVHGTCMTQIQSVSL